LKVWSACRGEAATPLAPDGYVQVQGEVWRALSTGPNIDKDDEIVIVEVRRLTLFVASLSNNIVNEQPAETKKDVQ